MLSEPVTEFLPGGVILFARASFFECMTNETLILTGGRAMVGKECSRKIKISDSEKRKIIKINFYFFAFLIFFISLFSPGQVPENEWARQFYDVSRAIPIIKAYSDVAQFPFALSSSLFGGAAFGLIAGFLTCTSFIRYKSIREKVDLLNWRQKGSFFIGLAAIFMFMNISNPPKIIGWRDGLY